MSTFVLIVIGIGLVVWIASAANEQRLEAKRQREEAKRRKEEAIRIVGETAPELAALRNAVTALRDFVADANAYRPNFRQVRFSFPFDVIFSRDCEGSGDGPDPEPWVTTVGNLLVPVAHELRSIYTTSNTFPRVELSPSDVKVVTADTPRKFLIWLGKLCTGEAQKLKQAANQLQNELAEQKRRAKEAIEHLAPIRNVYEEYATHTRNGIERHFQFALRTLALPLPANFPWSTFYDPNERLLQINQRVPFITDIVVKRPDSKRPPSKRDTDYFQRRLVPAVSLHIAQHVALNDLYDDLDSIAVNCWWMQCPTSTAVI